MNTMLPPSGMQRHIPVKNLLASSGTGHNTPPETPLPRCGPRSGSFHASLIGSFQSKRSGRAGENPNLGPCKVMTPGPVIGLLLRALLEVRL